MKSLLLALAITHVTVVNTAGPIVRDVTVVISDGRIASIGSGAPPPGAEIVDGRGKFVIPGLWDMRVHLSWSTSSSLPRVLSEAKDPLRRGDPSLRSGSGIGGRLMRRPDLDALLQLAEALASKN